MHEDIFGCLKKKKGIRLVEKNENLCEVYIRKAQSALNMLGSAVEKKETEWIFDTSYYARYFITYALFSKCGIRCEIHDCTILAFKHLFVDNNICPLELYNELLQSKNLRVDTLYYDRSISWDKVLEKANSAPDFVLKVEEIIRNITDEEILLVVKSLRNMLSQTK